MCKTRLSSTQLGNPMNPPQPLSCYIKASHEALSQNKVLLHKTQVAPKDLSDPEALILFMLADLTLPSASPFPLLVSQRKPGSIIVNSLFTALIQSQAGICGLARTSWHCSFCLKKQVSVIGGGSTHSLVCPLTRGRRGVQGGNLVGASSGAEYGTC